MKTIERGIIPTADQRLTAWIKSIVGEVEVALEVPRPRESGTGVRMYLLDVSPAAAMRTARELQPLRLSLRYIVMPWATNAADVHGMLSALAFGALTAPDLELEPEPLPAAVWQSWCLPMGPALVVRVPVFHSREAPSAPKVREVVVNSSPMQPLQGRLLGPGAIGVTDALVELPALHLATRTDASGRFYFSAVPAPLASQRLRLQVKGRQIEVESGDSPPLDRPLIIQLSEEQL